MFRSKTELCAGSKIPFPKMKVYQRRLEESKPDDSNKKYAFKLVKEIKNLVRIKKYNKIKSKKYHLFSIFS